MLGIAYKKNVDDVRESPAIEIMELIRDKGADVQYSDPHVPVFPKMREHKFDLASIQLNAEILQAYDAIVFTTNHDKFDFELIRNNAQLIIDTRGIYRNGTLNKIIRA